VRRFDRHAPWWGWIAALFLLVVGAGGVYHIVTTTTPIAGPADGGLSFGEYAQAFFNSPNVAVVALLLSALTVATWGGAWFVVRLLHWRFQPEFEPLKVWRQSLWVALFVGIGAWLQLSRALTLAMAVLVAGVLALIEVYLNVRERRD
jgi:hypothetical protein